MLSTAADISLKPLRDRSACWHLVMLIAIVVSIYGLRLDDLTIRGEESRRATVAMEMIATGDWIVPRQQGEPNFMSARPPLQNWAIAIIGLIRGQVDVVAVRLPSVVAVLATVLLLYGYSRTFLSSIGALATGAVYATMGQVMELGWLGETDALFTLFVSASLLLWHWGYTRRWHSAITWCSAWLCVALATLTKGLQAPTYFVGAVGVYLLITRRWRFAFTWSHLLGIVMALVVVGLWQVPFAVTMDAQSLRHIYAGDVVLYLNDWRLSHVAAHYAGFPFRVLGSLMPWSPLLLLFMQRDVRQAVSPHGDHLLFLSVCLAVAVPTVWFVPGAHARFVMPVYPCLAVIMGMIINCCVMDVACHRHWSGALRGLAAGIAVFAFVVLVASIVAPSAAIVGQPPTVAAIVIFTSVLLAALAWWSHTSATHHQRVVGILSVVTFTGIVYTGLVVSHRSRTSVDTVEQVVRLKQLLPDNAQLVSFGPTLHLFAYHYGKPIPLRPMPENTASLPADMYFCTVKEPPFPYAEVARINCDRSQSARPQNVVIIGHGVLTLHARGQE